MWTESLPARAPTRGLSRGSPQVLARCQQAYRYACCAACGRPPRATREPAVTTDSVDNAALPEPPYFFSDLFFGECWLSRSTIGFAADGTAAVPFTMSRAAIALP